MFRTLAAIPYGVYDNIVSFYGIDQLVALVCQQGAVMAGYVFQQPFCRPSLRVRGQYVRFVYEGVVKSGGVCFIHRLPISVYGFQVFLGLNGPDYSHGACRLRSSSLVQ